jgi:hypothetical protein
LIFAIVALPKPLDAFAADALSMSVAPQGLMTLSLPDAKAAVGGNWSLEPPHPDEKFDADELAVGSVAHTEATQDSPQHATVTQTFNAAAALVCEYQLIGDEDLRTHIKLSNNDSTKTLRKVRFSGLTFHFPHSPTGDLHYWDWGYLAAHGVAGVSLYHPSAMTPIGAAFAADDTFGFGAYTDVTFTTEARTMFNGRGLTTTTIMPDCPLSLYTDLTVPPQGSVELNVYFRISEVRAMENLLEPYKNALRSKWPTIQYKPDNRPLAQFASADAQHVTAPNPLGYHSPAARFDNAWGTQRYINTIVPRLRRADALGLIFWTLGGYNSRGAMYRPDFDEFPPVVAANVPTIVKSFKSAGLRVGLCARPSNGVRPAAGDNAHDEIYLLSADNAADMQMILGRFRHAMEMGFDIFYCDSFGENQNEVRILRKLRETVGPDVLLYTEHGSDLTLPLAGRYCEYDGDNLGGVSFESYKAMRYLWPEATWLCLSRTNLAVPPPFKTLGLVPLVRDSQIDALIEAAKPPPELQRQATPASNSSVSN